MLKNHLIPAINEVGCDEAGRGCLAGPVYAAAVILPHSYRNPILNDSKKLSPRVREILREEIEQIAVAWAVAWVDNDKIDEINILRASILAMHLAIDKLTVRPGHIIADGNRFFPYPGISHTCIVKGDATYASIAAASVLAKTWRDEYMVGLHDQFSYYAWNRNKGYPTPEHRSAIKKYGISRFHRKSFSLTDNQLKYEF